MPDAEQIETVDAELALDTPLAGFPAELPAHLAAELAELLEDAERYAAAAQALNTTRARTPATGASFKPGASATACRACRHRPPSSGCM
jgi:hypothetical protein